MQQLKRYEATGKYLFHGSGADLDMLVPRQATDYIEGAQVADGKPAVYATPHLAYAIFMAVMNERSCPAGFHCRAKVDASEKPEKLLLSVSKKTMKQIEKDAYGYVYVVPRGSLTKRSPGEYVTYMPVEPVAKIKVTARDLPGDIALFDDEA
jgi:hypothetical protein